MLRARPRNSVLCFMTILSHPGLILLESDPSSHHTLAGHTSAEGNVCSGWSKGQVRSKPNLICLLICQIRSIGEASEDLRRWHLEDDGLHHAGEHGDLNQEEQGLSQNFMKTTMHLFRGSKPCSLGDRNMCRLLPAWHKFLAHCISFDLSVQQPGSAETGSICHWMSAQRNKSLLNNHGKSVEMRYNMISCISHDACTHWRSTFQFCAMFRHPKD